jgi:Gluconate 2-dehydrogenase subunit 3
MATKQLELDTGTGFDVSFYDDQYVLNHSTKFLARQDLDQLHPDEMSMRIAQSWRFPVIDTYSDGENFEKMYALNAVTFIYVAQRNAVPQQVEVVGTFSQLFAPLPLRRIHFINSETRYFARTVVVPKGEVHLYKFVVDDESVLDPINPQRVQIENGRSWSRFFTQLCPIPLSLERWERVILERLTDHILPFRTREGQRFLDQYYQSLDRRDKETQYVRAYRLDEPVGAANFIDKLLAREENHHLVDYHICLSQIDRILRQRNPFTEPAEMNRELYVDLYNEMASNNVNGWNYEWYHDPRYFLQLLRRHTYTGAFAHPKYGGNVGGAGWAYLGEHFVDEQGKTLFAWQKASEKPLGASPDYHG